VRAFAMGTRGHGGSFFARARKEFAKKIKKLHIRAWVLHVARDRGCARSRWARAAMADGFLLARGSVLPFLLKKSQMAACDSHETRNASREPAASRF